jgi:hypothetical protein
MQHNSVQRCAYKYTNRCHGSMQALPQSPERVGQFETGQRGRIGRGLFLACENLKENDTA